MISGSSLWRANCFLEESSKGKTFFMSSKVKKHSGTYEKLVLEIEFMFLYFIVNLE